MEEPVEQPPKTFSVAEANALLPKIRPLVKQLQGLQRSIIDTTQQMDGVVAKLAEGNGYPIEALKQQVQELTKHQLQLIEAFQSALRQLEELGCMLKELSSGLVDFYAVRDGDLVFLCWKLEEDRIRFWHTLTDGYAGRQSLEAA